MATGPPTHLGPAVRGLSEGLKLFCGEMQKGLLLNLGAGTGQLQSSRFWDSQRGNGRLSSSRRSGLLFLAGVAIVKL